MSGPAKAPSKILADLDAYMRNWKPVAVADNTRVAIPMRPIAKVAAPEADTTKTLAKGASGEAVGELRIRLAGFGGVLPGTEFDESLEKAVKQFEKDVMGRAETGIVDNAFALRLDRFAKDWPIHFEKQLHCPCQKCEGFGKGQFYGEYNEKYAKSKDEGGHKYEYPGIHRSVLWASRALMLYATVDHKDKIRFSIFSSGYRCHIRNLQKGRPTTNHMGKAVDLQFAYNASGKWLENRPADVEAMRDVAKKRLNAVMGWATKDRFAMESAEQGAKTWVHLDVRAWSAKYRLDEFFCTNSKQLDGDSMVSLLAAADPASRNTEVFP